MTVVTLERSFFWRHHMSDRPVHVRGSEIVAAAVLDAVGLRAQPGRLIPVKCRPVAVFAIDLWHQQVIVLAVINLCGVMNLERPDSG